jgi:uncharacterized protein (TIGR00645 family)
VSSTADPTPAPTPTPARALSGLIFFSRWLQVPLYLGLIAAQLVYVWQFLKELWHLVEFALLGHGAPESMADFSMEATTMLLVLGLVDVVMISNLLIMVIIGGYETFVSRMRLNGHPDQLAMSIIGISSIHLLRTFIESSQGYVTGETMLWQTVIHLAFVVSALALALIDRMSQGSRAKAEPHAVIPA